MRKPRTTNSKTPVSLLAFVALVLSISGCRSQTPVPQPSVAETEPVPRPWAVIYSFGAEGLELRKETSITSDTIWEGRAIATGWLVKPVVLAASGVGIANAVAATQHVIDTYHPRAIILTGMAAAINPAHQLGDIIIPDQWINGDFGFWGNKRLEVDSVPVGRTDSAGFRPMMDIPVDTALARRMVAAAEGISFSFRTVNGRLPDVHAGGAGVSANALIASHARRKRLRSKLNAEIVDRESAAVVQTAHAAGIPVVVVRASTGLAGGKTETQSSAQQTRASLPTVAHNLALVIKRFLETDQ